MDEGNKRRYYNRIFRGDSNLTFLYWDQPQVHWTCVAPLWGMLANTICLITLSLRTQSVANKKINKEFYLKQSNFG